MFQNIDVQTSLTSESYTEKEQEDVWGKPQQ